MPSRFAAQRSAAYLNQAGRCFYCDLPMWQADPSELPTRHPLSPDQANRLRCTAEHLKARRDGGNNEAGNIAAACEFCNRARHQWRKISEPSGHRQRVQTLMQQGRWHPAEMLSAFGGGHHP